MQVNNTYIKWTMELFNIYQQYLYFFNTTGIVVNQKYLKTSISPY